MALHKRHNVEIPDSIIVRRDKFDYIGVECEFVKEKGDYAYYLRADGTCSELEWLNVKHLSAKLNKTVFESRKFFSNAILKEIELLKISCEEYIKDRDKEGWNF